MNKIILFCVAMLCLFGCGKGTDQQTGDFNETKPGISGYIVSKEGGRILVVSSEPKDFSDTGGLKEFYEAVFVSNVQQEVKIGQKVSVWFDGPILESFPAQAKAKNISVFPSKKPDGADLSESEVIRMALEKLDQSKEIIPAIKAVSYDEKSDTWDVLIKDTMFENKEYQVQVKDRQLKNQ